MSDNIKNTEFEIFPWQKNFDTGIEIIDNQHKKLVDILNLLASNLANRSKAVVLNKIFDELAEYANFHFESEEKVWVEYFKDDIWYQQHEKTHEKFIQQVLNLKKQGDKLELDTVIQNIVSFLTQWLTYHILDTDKRMAIVVQELKAGKPLAEAKKIADKKMSGSMKVLINTILKMYDTLSNRTMGFLRERALRLQAEAELMQSEERWKFILEGGVEGVWDWSIPENKISQSQDSETIFDRINESSSSKLSSTNIHPDDLLQMKQDFDDHLNGKTEFYSNKHRVLRNDICYWVLSRGKIVARDHEGQPTRMIGVNQDITEHQLASLIYQKSRQGMVIVSANEIIVSVNPAFSEMSGYKDNELIGNNLIHFLTTEKDESFYYDMWKTVRSKGKWQGTIWNQRKDETKFPQEIEISNIKDKNGNANYYLLLINDVTEKIKSDKKIFYQANYDYLTGIANRYLFQQNLEQEISNSQQNNKSFALLLIDLDNFKDINDIKGHNFGDQLLKNVAKKINKSVKNKNNIARFGGDEFTVIIPETDNHSQT
ncbi:MAG TPA: bacteriohemerythrin, partial [Gammaproteobacteria bacterium]|nr:bacteriohemerythrin [Gammaproteobacteria bacterium]